MHPIIHRQTDEPPTNKTLKRTHHQTFTHINTQTTKQLYVDIQLSNQTAKQPHKQATQNDRHTNNQATKQTPT